MITFKLNAGSSGYYNATTINRDVSSDTACRYWKKQQAQQNKFTLDSSHVSSSVGCDVIHGILIINLVSKSDADKFREFVTDKLLFIRPFRIEGQSGTGYNLGMGIDAPLDRCYIDGETSTENIIIPLARGGRYTIRLPYVCYDLVTVEGSFP